jgi:hypothetical protein
MKANTISERFSDSGQMQRSGCTEIADYSICDTSERWQILCRDVAESLRQFWPMDDSPDVDVPPFGILQLSEWPDYSCYRTADLAI